MDAKKYENIEKQLQLQKKITLLSSVIAIITGIISILSIPGVDKFIVSVFDIVSKNLDTTIEESMKTLKYLNDNYSGALGFLGSIIGGFLGFVGAILVLIFQNILNNMKERKKLMLLLLSTYESISIFLIWQSNGEKILKDKLKEFTLIRDNDWAKYLVQIRNFEDSENITEWFYQIEALKDVESELIELDKDVVQKDLKMIENILKKYRYRKYLEEVNQRLEKYKKDENVEYSWVA